MLIIGHRGAAGLEAENTIRSFQKAEELGVDMIEMDLRLRRDGEIVVVHDPDPKKIYEGAPRLVDVLPIIKIPVNLEIKEPGFEKKLLEAIKEFPFEILISSFKPQVLKKIRILDRNIQLGLIIAPKKQWDYLFVPITLFFSFFLKLHSVNPHYLLLTASRMQLMRRLKLRVFPWVINTQEEFRKTKQLGVDGVITDYPNLWRK